MPKPLKVLKYNKHRSTGICLTCKIRPATVQLKAFIINRERGIMVICCAGCLDKTEKKFRKKLCEAHLKIGRIEYEPYTYTKMDMPPLKFNMVQERKKAQQFKELDD